MHTSHHDCTESPEAYGQLQRAGFQGGPRTGAVAVWVALMLLVLLGFVGLALDSAHVLTAKQQLQSAADAAALAATAQVASDPDASHPSTPYQTTRQAAIAIATQNDAAKSPVLLDPNYSNDPSGDIVVGDWDASTQTFTPDTASPDSVMVTARRTAVGGGGPLGLNFGDLFGKPSADVDRTAVATFGSGQDPVILVLDLAGNQALSIKGTPSLAAIGRDVHVNSSAAQALYLNGSPDDPRLRAGSIRVHGGASYPSGSVLPAPVTNSWVEPDYLMYLPDHPDPTNSLPNYDSITSAGTYDPGWYPNGIDFNSGVAMLNPGVYVIGPPGINLKADAQVVGNEVMLFVDLGAEVQIAGQGVAGLDLGAPTSGLWEGICVYQHRQNSNLCDIQGGGLFELRGTMYLKSAQVEMDGTVHREVGRFVVFRMLLRGNGTYNVPGIGPPNTKPKAPYLVR